MSRIAVRGVFILLIGFTLIILPLRGWSLTITLPQDGIEVFPGQSLPVIAEPSPNEELEMVQFTTLGQSFLDKASPFEFTAIVPMDTIGPMKIGVLSKDKRSGKLVGHEVTVLIVLASDVKLQSIEVDSRPIFLLLEPAHGRTGKITVSGLFSDGGRRVVTTYPGTTFESSNEDVVTVDSNGVIQAVAVGRAKIIVRNGKLRVEKKVIVNEKVSF